VHRFAGIGDITTAALAANVPPQKSIHVRTQNDIASLVVANVP
jgi:hypothetical protein